MTDAEDSNLCSVPDDSCLYEFGMFGERRSSQELSSYTEFCREAVQTFTTLAYSLNHPSSNIFGDFFSGSQSVDYLHVSKKIEFASKRSRSSQRITDSPSKKRPKLEHVLPASHSQPYHSSQELENEHELLTLFQLFHERLSILQSHTNGRSVTLEIDEFISNCSLPLIKNVANPSVIMQFIVLLNKCISIVGKECINSARYFMPIFGAFLSLLEKQVKLLHCFTDTRGATLNVTLEVYGRAVGIFSPLISLMGLFRANQHDSLQSIYREIYQNFIALALGMIHHAKEMHSKSRHSACALSSLCHTFLQSLISSLSTHVL